MKVGKKAIKTSKGKIINFKSEKKLENWERIAKAVKYGFKIKKDR